MVGREDCPQARRAERRPFLSDKLLVVVRWSLRSAWSLPRGLEGRSGRDDGNLQL